ncbi:MAG: SIS domain-containing protein [Halodesulfovibrio sp.]|uniref:KpsF/GutQ family sugar-phosphate isomerase n=1 Tax=Halodesulfovibrio sp. TaxID=1912772 RepID=UPI00359E9395
MKILQSAINALQLEIEALQAMQERMDNNVVDAVNLLLNTNGRVIFTGMGKAGHVARKLAATFSSTGTPSIFMHPGEAYHGDLGVVTKNDLAIMISNSGETEEVVKLIPCLKRYNVSIISLTGNINSTMAQHSDVVLDTHVAREACPLNCAPTSSTTTAIAMGDAIACALIEARGFKAEDFAVFHPGGSLGARLLLKISDIMLPFSEAPTVLTNAPIHEAIIAISKGRIGSVFVVDENRIVKGILTDGDLRRLLESGSTDFNDPVSKVSNLDPKTVRSSEMAASVLNQMEQAKISVVPVIKEDQTLLGAIHVHMLLAAGIV